MVFAVRPIPKKDRQELVEVTNFGVATMICRITLSPRYIIADEQEQEERPVGLEFWKSNKISSLTC